MGKRGLRAKDLIAKARGRGSVTPPSADVIAEIREILAHNDSLSTTKAQRVFLADAHALAQERGYKLGIDTFKLWIKQHFDRKSWVAK